MSASVVAGGQVFEKDQIVKFTSAALKSDCCVGEKGRRYLVMSVKTVGASSLKVNKHPQRVDLQKICKSKKGEGCVQTESRLDVSGFLIELVKVKPKKK